MTGAAALVGATGVSTIWEGDIRYSQYDGFLYGLTNPAAQPNTYRLLRISPSTGAATPITLNGASFHDLDGLAIHPTTGAMYILEGQGNIQTNAVLYRIAPTTGDVLATLTLDRVEPGTLGGLEFDAAGNLFLVSGYTYSSGGIDRNLYRIDLTNGTTTLVGDTGITDFCGLAYVPEPSAALGIATLILLGRHRPR